MINAREKFSTLGLWDGGESTGPWHMAMDEAMARNACRPLLRWYRWEREEISFGYPQRWRDVEPFAAGRPAVRRWTGGGIVEHGADFTIALAVPARDYGGAPSAFYEAVHRAVAASLGAATRLATADDCARGAVCFENPARFDVLKGARKIAGGAIRRTRDGMLYQGSIQAAELPGDFIPQLAEQLAEENHPWQPDAQTLALAGELRASRYATHAWRARR